MYGVFKIFHCFEIISVLVTFFPFLQRVRLEDWYQATAMVFNIRLMLDAI